MIKIAICEPSGGLAGNVEDIIRDAAGLLTEKLETEVYMSGADFENALDEGEIFGIVYMNMDMRDTDGIALGKKLREKHSVRETLLIYLSQQESLTERVFDAQPYLFIGIPFDKRDFIKKLYIAVESIRQYDDLFTFKKGGTVYQLKKREIICLESEGRDIIISALGREDIRYREAIKNEQEKLNAINFVRPHQSFIVNLDYVEQYRSESMVLTNKIIIPISELRMKDTKKAVLKFWEYRNLYNSP